MLKKLCIAVAVATTLVFSSNVMAKEGHSGDCTSCHSLTEKDASKLLSKIGVTAKTVKASPLKGLYEVLVEKDGKQGILFIDYGKKHFMQGMIVNLESMEQISPPPQPKQSTSLDVSKIPVENAVIMGNPKGSKKLYVFTDPDCPYCRKGHTELKKLAAIAPDVAIHVMLYPLPMHPAAYDKSRAVLETKSLDMMDKIFEGKDVPKPTNESSKKAIDEIIAFANANGISGTPTMVMPDGKIEVGMRDAETMKKMLEVK